MVKAKTNVKNNEKKNVSVEPVEIVMKPKETIMKTKNWIEKNEAVPTIVDTKEGKIHVQCIGNRGSFENGQDYFVSPRMFEAYKSILQIIE